MKRRPSTRVEREIWDALLSLPGHERASFRNRMVADEALVRWQRRVTLERLEPLRGGSGWGRGGRDSW